MGAAAVANALGWGRVTWLVVTMAVLLPVVGVPFKIVSGRLEARLVRAGERWRALADNAVGGGRLRVQDGADPTALGVHPATLPEELENAGAHEAVPTYVRRDQHDALVARLTAGRFVLLQVTPGRARAGWR